MDTAGQLTQMLALRLRLEALRNRTSLVSFLMVLLVAGGALLVPRTGPSTLAFGLAFGCGNALAALGVVLIYRSSRVINFAQVQLGAVTAVLFAEMINHHVIFSAILGVCPDCGSGLGFLRQLDYWGAAAATFLVAPVLALGVFLILLLLRRAPGFVSTVATIAIGQALAVVAASVIPTDVFKENNISGIGLSVDMTPPVDMRVVVAGGAVLHLGQIGSIVVASLATLGLVLFLRYSRLGTAIRASAEDSERSANMGINAISVQATVWILAGCLSGAAAILQSMATGNNSAGTVTSALVVRVLVAAILAGLESIPLAFAASIVLAILDQAFYGAYTNTLGVDGVLFVVVLVVLLLRPRGPVSRFDPEASVWRLVREVRPTPAVLRAVPVVRRLRRLVVAVVAVAVLGIPVITAPGDLEGFTTLLVYALVGMSLLIVTGWMGQISLGQFAFVAVGAFVTAVTSTHWGFPPPVAVIAGALAGAATAVVVGLPGLRIRGLYLAVTSLAFSLATAGLLLSPSFAGQLLPDRLDRPVLLGIDLEDERVFYYLMLVVLLLVTLALGGMRRSRTGRAAIALRDNDRSAQSFGLPALVVRVELFAISGFIAAFAGGLFAYEQHGVRIGSYSPETSLLMFLMIIVGGLGSITGAVLGALFLGVAPVAAAINTDAPALGQAFVVVLLLATAPGGLSQLAFSLRDAFLRRVAERNQLDVPSLAGRRSGQSARTAIAPKLLRGGGTAFVPQRYRMPEYRGLKPTVPKPGVRR